MDAGLNDMIRMSLKGVWRDIRSLSGEDAYERYLVHWQEHHRQDASPPLDRKAFFEQQQERKWNGIKRCC
jgi:uncharacterized short protein YbdD (DUF466 family)